MSRDPIHRLRVGVLAALCALGSLVALSAPVGASAPAQSNGKALVIEHRFGEAEIPKTPKRIVSLDVQWTDVLLAMGVKPIAYGSADAPTKSGRYPWQKGLKGAEHLEVNIDEIPYEQIAALDPDLIVASWQIGSESTYDKLAAIAPTIGPLGPNGEQVDAWQDMAAAAGSFLRAKDKATAVEDRVQDEIAEVAADLPEIEGKTFTLSQYLPGDGIYVVADPDDGSSRFFADLELVMYPAVVDAGKAQGEARPKFSAERADILGADFVVFFSPADSKTVSADLPGFDALPAVKSGALARASFPLVLALNTPSPLSIEYAIDRLQPQLEAAAKS